MLAGGVPLKSGIQCANSRNKDGIWLIERDGPGLGIKLGLGFEFFDLNLGKKRPNLDPNFGLNLARSPDFDLTLALIFSSLPLPYYPCACPAYPLETSKKVFFKFDLIRRKDRPLASPRAQGLSTRAVLYQEKSFPHGPPWVRLGWVCLFSFCNCLPPEQKKQQHLEHTDIKKKTNQLFPPLRSAVVAVILGKHNTQIGHNTKMDTAKLGPKLMVNIFGGLGPGQALAPTWPASPPAAGRVSGRTRRRGGSPANRWGPAVGGGGAFAPTLPSGAFFVDQRTVALRETVGSRFGPGRGTQPPTVLGRRGQGCTVRPGGGGGVETPNNVTL